LAPRDGAYVKYVSGKHALLTAVDSGVEVACTASLEGQWLRIGDGARVRRGGSTTARAGDIIHLGAGVPGGAAVEGFPPIAFRLALVPRDAALEVERGVPDAVAGGAAAADAPCVLFRAEGQSVTVRGAASSLRTALIASAIAGAGFDVTAWVSEGRAAISGDALRGAPFGGRHERAYRAAAVRLNLIGEGYSVRSSFTVGQTVQLTGNGVCTYSSPEQCTHVPRHVWKVKSRKRERSPSPQGGGGGGGGGSGGGRASSSEPTAASDNSDSWNDLMSGSWFGAGSGPDEGTADGTAGGGRQALKVVVYEAQGLPDIQLFGTQDPYVRVSLVYEGEASAAQNEGAASVRCCAVDSGGTDPSWVRLDSKVEGATAETGSVLRLPLSPELHSAIQEESSPPRMCSLLLEIWNENAMTDDEIIGSTRLRLTAGGLGTASVAFVEIGNTKWYDLDHGGRVRCHVGL